SRRARSCSTATARRSLMHARAPHRRRPRLLHAETLPTRRQHSMFFKRFYDDSLAQASYMIGCQRTGEALVVDPNRDIAQYIDPAREEKLRTPPGPETQIHADFVSGARELAAQTGAQLLLSAEGGADWQYTYAADAGARLLHDGDVFTIGNIRVEVLHTP